MTRLVVYVIATMLLLSTQTVRAGEDRTEAVVGGAVGGAVGAAIGNELGDRNGAIVGAAVGAAVGTAVATDDDGDGKRNASVPVKVEVGAASGHPHGRHCPPGQAKKGRC